MGFSLPESLSGRPFARQRAFGELRIEGPCLRRRAATGREGLDPEDSDGPAEGEAQHVADSDRRVSAVDRPAVEAEAALLGHRLRQGAGLHDPGEPEELVEPQAVSHAGGPRARRRRATDRAPGSRGGAADWGLATPS